MTSSDKYSRKNNNGFCVAKHFIYIFLNIFLNLILCHLIFILHIIYFYFLCLSMCVCLSQILKVLKATGNTVSAISGSGETGHKEVHGATPKTSLCLLGSLLVNC